jgi:hypothetical protein
MDPQHNNKDLMELIKTAEDTVQVYDDDIKSGTAHLYSEGFGSCIGILFLDRDMTKGTEGHLSINTDPWQCFHGYVDSLPGIGPRRVERLSDIYPNPAGVKAVQIYDKNGYTWHPKDTKRMLAKLHFTDFGVYVIESPSDKVHYKKIALAVKTGLVHIDHPLIPDLITFSIFDVPPY